MKEKESIDKDVENIQLETTECMEKMAGIKPCKEKYFKLSMFGHIKSRILWLIILMLSAMVAGVIITHYEEVFEAAPLLIAFIPMLMATGGNSGSQTSTLIIRGLSVKDIKNSDIWKVFRKELMISIIIGLMLAILNGIWVVIIYKDFLVAVAVGLTLIGTIAISKLLGCLLPILAKKFKIDPAVMAAPLIMTIIDVVAMFLYVMIAIMILGL